VRYVADDQDGGAQLAFIGRIDSQVKIRGFRIELGEIETQLSLCEHVEGALVLAVEGATGDQRLVAYVVATLIDDDCSANLINEVKTRLLQTLPTYMVPSAFVVLAQFPLTPNGKIDKKALPAPDGSLLQGKYVAPQSDSEKVLAQVWAKLLHLEVDSISVTANFFELGGHSLLAVLLVAEIRQDMAIEVPIKALFEHSTVQALAVLVDSLLAMKFVNERQHSATVMSEGCL
jgi:acyl carrier protein